MRFLGSFSVPLDELWQKSFGLQPRSRCRARPLFAVPLIQVHESATMQTLKHICQTIIQFFRSLPQAIQLAGKERKERSARNELEVERIDRLRNPSKYRGK